MLFFEQNRKKIAVVCILKFFPGSKKKKSVKIYKKFREIFTTTKEYGTILHTEATRKRRSKGIKGAKGAHVCEEDER